MIAADPFPLDAAGRARSRARSGSVPELAYDPQHGDGGDDGDRDDGDEPAQDLLFRFVVVVGREDVLRSLLAHLLQLELHHLDRTGGLAVGVERGLRLVDAVRVFDGLLQRVLEDGDVVPVLLNDLRRGVCGGKELAREGV